VEGGVLFLSGVIGRFKHCPTGSFERSVACAPVSLAALPKGPDGTVTRAGCTRSGLDIRYIWHYISFSYTVLCHIFCHIFSYDIVISYDVTWHMTTYIKIYGPTGHFEDFLGRELLINFDFVEKNSKIDKILVRENCWKNRTNCHRKPKKFSPCGWPSVICHMSYEIIWQNDMTPNRITFEKDIRYIWHYI